MFCPNCSKKLDVIDSRPHVGRVYRRRTCNYCKKKFSTCEVIGSLKEIEEKIIRLKKIKTELQGLTLKIDSIIIETEERKQILEGNKK